MFDTTYPIARMAAETGELEDSAKTYRAKDTGATKNAVCLWTEDVVFGWNEFAELVEPRMRTLRSMFEGNEKGKALIYRIIALLRTYEMGVSAPRLAYLLARSFEDDHKRGGGICRQLYAWAQDPAERRTLVAALEWYACSTRETRSEQ
jgi:CRISPR-associated protein Csm1